MIIEKCLQKIKIIKKKLKKKYYLLFVLLLFIIFSFESRIIYKNSLYKNIYNRFVEDQFFIKGNEKCDNLDPIYIMGQRFKKSPSSICKSESSEHICYQSSKYDYYNNLYRFPNGVICLMKNILSELIYNFSSIFGKPVWTHARIIKANLIFG